MVTLPCFWFLLQFTLHLRPLLAATEYFVGVLCNMENVIRVKNEIDSDGTGIAVTCKRLPSSDEDDYASTPLRAETEDYLPDQAVPSSCGAAWESDAEDEVEIPSAPAPPSLEFERNIKHSPTNDQDLTPLRVTTDTERTEPIGPPPERQSNGSSLDVPDNYFHVLLANSPAPVSNAKVKKEERREIQLGFLDILSDADLEGITNAFSQVNEVDNMDLEPPMVQSLNIPESDEERELQARIELGRKELDKLERSATEKKRKKHKKEKKHDGHKKRRRSRSPSRSRSPQSDRKERRIQESDRGSASRHNPIRIVKAEPAELDYVPVQEDERSVKVVNISKLMETPTLKPTLPPRTIKEKRQLAVERVKNVLQLMRLKASKAPPTEFLVVDTIKKITSRAAYMSSDVFENPSPLCNNFNVSYKFNSTNSSNVINMTKWGLERLPDTTIALLRLTGIDATRLTELQRNPKMLLHKLRSKQAAENSASKAEDESLSTGLYKSVTTQTDARIGNRSRDVGVQAMPVKSNHGVYWLNQRFDETDLTQQQTNVLLALKELCATTPSSPAWAEKLFRELRPALAIKRAEVKELGH